MAAAKIQTFEAFSKSIREKGDSKLGIMSSSDVIQKIPTGSVILDKLSGIGGIPLGRLTQIASEPSVGKSTLALTVAASCQRMGGKVLYLDFEQSLTAAYIKKMGCNLDDGSMLVAQPMDINRGWDLVAQASMAGIHLVVLDSIASMFPEVADEDMRELKHQIGYQARGLAAFLPKIKSQAREKNFAVLAINQVRAKISMGFGSQFQKTPAYSMELPGGWAPKFYTDLMYFMSTRKTEKTPGITLAGDREELYSGQENQVMTWKNKVGGMPYRKANMFLKFGVGIDDFRSVKELACSTGLIDMRRNGVWTFNSLGDFNGIPSGEPILSGRSAENLTEQLTANPEVYAYLRQKVLSQDLITESLEKDEAEAYSRLMDPEDNGDAAPIIQAPALAPPPIPESAGRSKKDA